MLSGILRNRPLGLLPGLALALILAACTVQAGDLRGPDHAAGVPPAAQQPAPAAAVNPPAAPILVPGDCGRLCDNDFWEKAGPAEVRAELDRGADLTATDGDLGGTALHIAALPRD